MGLNIAENICAPILSGAPSDFPGSFGILGADWLQLTFLALLASLLALSIIYMLSFFLKQNAAAAWAKFELFQLFATAMLVVMTSSVLIVGMCSFDMRILDPDRYADPQNPNRPMNMLDIVDRYFGELEKAGGMLFAAFLFIINILTNLFKAMFLSSPLGVGGNESPLESLMQLNNMFFILISGFVISFLMLGVQTRMVEYISIAALYYLFPFGVFFRAFEPTRAFGGTLIGLSISLFLFYPALLVFNDYVVYGPVSEINQELEDSIDRGDTQVSGQQGGMPDSQVIVNGIESGDLASGIGGSVLVVFKPLMLYFVAAVVLPIINFIILVEVARGLTRLLGEEVDITNLTRLI